LSDKIESAARPFYVHYLYQQQAEIEMDYPTWMFLAAAIVLAIVVGRLGTVLKERFASD